MRINHLARELDVKIALVGPVGGGKRTMLEAFLPIATPRGKPHYVDRVHNAVHAGAIFLDFMPKSSPVINGNTVRIHLHSMVPPYREAAIEYSLEDADAMIFVADSTRGEENVVVLERLKHRAALPPIVFLLNKRDLPDIASVNELRGDLEVGDRPVVEGIATQELGLIAVVKSALLDVLQRR